MQPFALKPLPQIILNSYDSIERGGGITISLLCEANVELKVKYTLKPGSAMLTQSAKPVIC